MMKIVINKCYGGFSLSHEGMLEYCAQKGIKVYPEENTEFKSLGPTYWTKPASERPKPIKDWHSASSEERRAYNEAYSECSIYCRDIERTDPALVATVEKIGDKASGSLAKLKVVDIPDGKKWFIDDYDGVETVHEEHETWG